MSNIKEHLTKTREFGQKIFNNLTPEFVENYLQNLSNSVDALDSTASPEYVLRLQLNVYALMKVFESIELVDDISAEWFEHIKLYRDLCYNLMLDLENQGTERVRKQRTFRRVRSTRWASSPPAKTYNKHIAQVMVNLGVHKSIDDALVSIDEKVLEKLELQRQERISKYKPARAWANPSLVKLK